MRRRNLNHLFKLKKKYQNITTRIKILQAYHACMPTHKIVAPLVIGWNGLLSCSYKLQFLVLSRALFLFVVTAVNKMTNNYK